MENILIPNNIIEFLDEGKSERILWISHDYLYCYTIDLYTDRFCINNRNMDYIIDSLKRKVAIKKEYSKYNLRTDKTISASDFEMQKIAKEKIDYIFERCNEPYIYEAKFRGEIINEVIRELGCSKTSIYKYLRKYLQGGKSINSLLPSYYSCGGRNKPKKLSNKKIGRPNLISKLEPDKNGINATENIKKIFIKVIDDYYLNERETPLSEVYKLMIQEHFSYDEVVGEELVKKPLTYNKIPNERQFRYWCDRLVEIEEIIRKRKGDKEYENNYKGLVSNSTLETFGPCFKAQVDAKICNVQILNRLRNRPIGKPVRYHVVDQFSSYIMGIYVGLDGPSWEGVSSALFNCIEDKVEFCSRYGVSIKEGEWINSTIPKVLLADRGSEFSGKLLNYATDNLDMIVQNTKAYTASNKGIVEQSFRTTEMKMTTFTPGAPKSKGQKRGDKDPRKEAVYTIEDITQTYINIVIHHNNKVIKNHPYANELIKENIVPTPLNIYKWGIKKFSGGLRAYDIDFVKLNLMRRGGATVTAKGIKFRDFYYDCEKAIIENWYTQARVKKSWRVDISFDTRNMNNIYIINEADNRFEICTLRSECSFYKDCTFEEIEDYLYNKNVSSESIYRDHGNQNDLTLNERLRNIKESALSKSSDIMKDTKQKKSGVSASRKEDNSIYRKTQALYIENKQSFSNMSHIEGGNNEEDSDNYMFNRLRRFRESKNENE